MSTPRSGPSRRWRSAALAIFAVAGGLFVTSALNARGQDLQSTNVTDLSSLVQSQSQSTHQLQEQVAQLNAQVNDLTRQVKDRRVNTLQRQVDALKGPAGLSAVSGSGVSVALNDAPESEIEAVEKSGAVPVDALLVHQQDIQAVVNALWSGGAQAISVMGQRIVSTTGIKCVGNSVVLQGVPYPPPYVITAVGDPLALQHALNKSAYVSAYRKFVVSNKLGYAMHVKGALRIPAFAGSLQLHYAQRVPLAPAAGDSGSDNQS